MTNTPQSRDEPFSAGALLRLDQACDRFEAAWRAGERPQLEDFLGDVAGPDKQELFRELLAVELACRRQRGERPTPGDYRARFPQYIERIQVVFQEEAGVDKEAQASLTRLDLLAPAPWVKAAAALGPPDPPAAGGGSAPVLAGVGELGRYAFVEKIGAGGMGMVLRVHEPVLNRYLALKVLKEEHRGCPDLERRFLEEAQIAGQLQHPGIVPIHELGTLPDGRPFFTMRLVKGRTLGEQLASRASPADDLPRFLMIFEQVCQAMAYAHARRVIHRDLKPSNVMVGAFGEVQVMDWGLAKVLPVTSVMSPTEAPATEEAPASVVETVRSASGEKATAGALGTWAYMPPEQALGETGRVDQRADVFGLGAILCKILTGESPYVGTDAQVQLQAKLGQVQQALGRLETCGAAAELVRLAKACLAPRPEERPQDAGAVAQGISTYQRGVQEHLRQAELARAQAEVQAQEERKRRAVEQARAQAEGRRRRATIGLGVALLLLVCGAAAAALWYQNHQARLDAEQSQRSAEAQRRKEAREEAIRRALEQAGQQLDELHKRLQEPNGVFALLNRPSDWRLFLNLARQSLEHAEKLKAAAQEPIEEDLAGRVRQLTDELMQDDADLRLALRLEKIREDRSGLMDRRSMDRQAAQQYSQAFREARLEVLPGREPELARSVARSRIKGALLSALDDWALAAAFQLNDVYKNILEVTRRADPGPWTDRLRDPRNWSNRAALDELVKGVADEVQLKSLTPQTLVLWGALLQANKADTEDWRRHAQELYPADFWLNFELANIFGETNLRQAEGFCRAALAARSGSPAAWTMLGVLRDKQGDQKGASAHYQKALVLDAKYAPAWNNFGNVWKRQGDLKQAAEHYWEAIKLNPTLGPPWSNLGYLLADKGDYVRAAMHFRKSLEMDSSQPDGWLGLGSLFMDKRKLKEARFHLEMAVKVDPRCAPAWYRLGNLVLWAGDPVEEAKPYFAKALAIKPRYVEALLNAGYVLLKRGDHKGAVKYYEKALALDQRSGIAWVMLGAARLEQGNPKGAVDAFRKAVGAEPNNPGFRSELGTALTRLGEFQEAADMLEEGRRLLPQLKEPLQYSVEEVQEQLAAALATNRQMLDVEKRLENVLRGAEATPTDRIDLAIFCGIFKRRYHDTVQLCTEAFSEQPELADTKSGLRYNAACFAAMAAAGKGDGNRRLTEKERDSFRSQALRWLRQELDARAISFQMRRGRPETYAALYLWQFDPDLTSVRERKELRGLPDALQQPWRQLWKDVNQIWQRVEASSTCTELAGLLTDKQPQQVHELAVKAGRAYVIEIVSKDFEPVLRMEDANGKSLKDFDRAYSPIDSNIHIAFPARRDETRRLVIILPEGQTAGEYEITIREFPSLNE
jgi:serine/threonine-protein kinase